MAKDTVRHLLDEVEELKRRVRDLEQRPVTYQPVYGPHGIPTGPPQQDGKCVVCGGAHGGLACPHLEPRC